MPADRGHSMREFLRRFARTCAALLGTPEVFLVAIGTILVWGALGPHYHSSDTWQLVSLSELVNGVSPS